MRNYRGYYIDKNSENFKSKEAIDEFIKNRHIERLQNLCRKHRDDLTFEWIAELDRIEQYLVKQCGCTWEDVEAWEVAA